MVIPRPFRPVPMNDVKPPKTPFWGVFYDLDVRADIKYCIVEKCVVGVFTTVLPCRAS